MIYAYRPGDWEAAIARSAFKVEWDGAGRKAECRPDPQYPNGIVVDTSSASPAWCAAKVKYPAPECGAYTARCIKCKRAVAATAAGRPDDPQVIVVACAGRRSGL